MGANTEKIISMFENRRICCLKADKNMFSRINLELENMIESPVMTFELPHLYYFKNFINSTMNQICDKLLERYEDKLHGVVCVYLGEDEYLEKDGEDMVRAYIELLSRTTMMMVLLAGSSDELTQMLFKSAAHFGVPGMLTLQDEGRRSRAIIESTVERLGLRFENAVASKQTVQLYEDICDSPVFRVETLLKAIAGNNMTISAASIKKETDDRSGYYRMCRELMEDRLRGKELRDDTKKQKRIGFLTLAERGEEEAVSIKERSGLNVA